MIIFSYHSLSQFSYIISFIDNPIVNFYTQLSHFVEYRKFKV